MDPSSTSGRRVPMLLLPDHTRTNAHPGRERIVAGTQTKKIRTNTHTHTLAGCPTRALPERNLPAPPSGIFPRQQGPSRNLPQQMLLLASGNNVPPGRRFYAPHRNLLRQNQNKTKLSNLTRGGAPGQSSGTTFRRRNHGGFVDEKRRWHGGGDDDGFKHGIFSILKVRNHGFARSRGQSETRAR